MREAPQPSHPKLGSRLQLGKWVHGEDPAEVSDMLVIQVLSITPWKDLSDTTATDYLHELLVVIWNCISPTNPQLTSASGLQLKQFERCTLYARLPVFVEQFATHGYQKQHLGLSFSREDLQASKEYSQRLYKAFNNEIEMGAIYQMVSMDQEEVVNSDS